MVPSADKLITPDRSVIVSPKAAKSKGVEVAMATDKIAMRSVASTMADDKWVWVFIVSCKETNPEKTVLFF